MFPDVWFVVVSGLLLLLVLFLSFRGPGPASDFMAKVRVKTRVGKKIRSRDEISEVKRRQQLSWVGILLAVLIILALSSLFLFYLRW